MEYWVEGGLSEPRGDGDTGSQLMRPPAEVVDNFADAGVLGVFGEIGSEKGVLWVEGLGWVVTIEKCHPGVGDFGCGNVCVGY